MCVWQVQEIKQSKVIVKSICHAPWRRAKLSLAVLAPAARESCQRPRPEYRCVPLPLPLPLSRVAPTTPAPPDAPSLSLSSAPSA